MNGEGEGPIHIVPNVSSIPKEHWRNDVSLWPTMDKDNIQNYLIDTPSIDGSPNSAYLSLEAVDFLISGWVDTAMISVINEETVVLKAKVARSQSTTKDEHDAWVFCQRNGEVLMGSCSCMAGLGRVCSHVASILFKILEANKHNLNKVSCTDSPMTWNSSTRRHVFPEKVKNLKRKKHFSHACHSSISPSKTFEQHYSDNELKASVVNNPFSTLMNLESTLWHSILNASEDTNNLPKVQPQNIHTAHEDDYSIETSHTNFSISCDMCRTFYNKYEILNSEQQLSLCNKTLNQAGSDVWIDSRKIRITASTASKCPKRSETKPDKFLKAHVYGTFKGNANTEHGVKHEPEAIKRFKEITNFDVSVSGTVVCENDNWLSASPDGLIGSECILEVKCPIKDVLELVNSGKYDVRKNADNFLHRSGKNGYFLQVQLTMHCTKRSICYLFVWGINTSVLVTVEYDQEFVTKELERLRTFYFKKMLPFLCAEKLQDKLLFGRNFLELMCVSK